MDIGAGLTAQAAVAEDQLQLDLFEELASLRSELPVVHLAPLGLWMVSRYADCVAVLRDPERFTSSRLGDMMQPVPEQFRTALPGGYPVSCPALVNNDPPGHTRIRKLAQRSFGPGAVARHEPAAVAIADELIDAFGGDGRADIVAQYARPLPCTMLATILGIAPSDQDRFIEWGLGVTELMSPFTLPERRLELAAGQVDFAGFVTGLVTQRRRQPREDMISELVHATADDEPMLVEREVLAIVAQLLTAGFETTMAGIANAVMLLFQHPETLARVRQDHTVLNAVVEESLRRLPPARGALRETTCDVELGGEVIPAGARVFVLVASANHDEAQFCRPRRFDIDRPVTELRRHLAFGYGPHYCIGALLARMEIRVGVERLLTRLPGLAPVPGQVLEWSPNLVFNGPERFEVTWPVSSRRGAGRDSPSERSQ